MEPANYTDLHREFLQNCAYLSCIEKSQCKQILSSISTKYSNTNDENQILITDEYLDEIINETNQHISRFHQKIQLIESETEINKVYLIICNTIASTVMMHQSLYNKSEVQYFQMLLKAIVTNDNQSLSIIVALNLISQLPDKIKTLNKSRAEFLIDHWSGQGYFYQADSDNIFLGPRAMAELGVQLKQQFPDFVIDCLLCRNPMLIGISCTDCGTLLHKNCMKKYLAKSSKCPKCKVLWTAKI